MSQTPHKVRAALLRAGIRPRRDQGQHFLMDPNLVRSVADAGEVSTDDVVFEVGTPSLLATRVSARYVGNDRVDTT